MDNPRMVNLTFNSKSVEMWIAGNRAGDVKYLGSGSI